MVPMASRLPRSLDSQQVSLSLSLAGSSIFEQLIIYTHTHTHEGLSLNILALKQNFSVIFTEIFPKKKSEKN